MNLQSAALVMLTGAVAACWPVPVAPLRFDQRFEPAQQLMEPKAERELTFEERWEPVKQLPRMLLPEVQDVGPRIVPVRTIPIRAEPAVYIEPPEQKEPPLPAPRPRAIVFLRKASLDLCQRHNMRKVFYGRTWRCRK